MLIIFVIIQFFQSRFLLLLKISLCWDMLQFSNFVDEFETSLLLSCYGVRFLFHFCYSVSYFIRKENEVVKMFIMVVVVTSIYAYNVHLRFVFEVIYEFMFVYDTCHILISQYS